METSSCCAASAFFQVLDFHGSHPSSVRMWDWASMTQVGNRKIWGAALRARLFPRAEWNTLTWCLLRLTYLKCSFCLEPKFSELVFCLTRNSNMSFQIWKPKCSHLSWKIWVPNERLPLKLKISDNWKALAIYFFKQAMAPRDGDNHLPGAGLPTSAGKAEQTSEICPELGTNSCCSSDKSVLNFKQMLKHFA